MNFANQVFQITDLVKLIGLYKHDFEGYENKEKEIFKFIKVVRKYMLDLRNKGVSYDLISSYNYHIHSGNGKYDKFILICQKDIELVNKLLLSKLKNHMMSYSYGGGLLNLRCIKILLNDNLDIIVRFLYDPINEIKVYNNIVEYQDYNYNYRGKLDYDHPNEEIECEKIIELLFTENSDDSSDEDNMFASDVEDN